MKLFGKLSVFVFIIMALTAASSFAVTYDGSDNKMYIGNIDFPSFDSEEYTVMVLSSDANLDDISSDDILYVNQGTEFGTFIDTGLGLRGTELPSGTYNLYVGGDLESGPNITRFKVGKKASDVDVSPSVGLVSVKETEMNVTEKIYDDEEGSGKRVAYIAEINNYNSEKYTYGMEFKAVSSESTKTATLDYPHDPVQISGGASYSYGFYIYNIPDGVEITAEPYVDVKSN